MRETCVTWFCWSLQVSLERARYFCCACFIQGFQAMEGDLRWDCCSALAYCAVFVRGTDCTYVDIMFLLRLMDCGPEAFGNFWLDKLMFYTKIFRTNFEWKIAALTWAIIACKQTSALENLEGQARWYNEMSSLWKFLCLFLLVSGSSSSRLSKTSLS